MPVTYLHNKWGAICALQAFLSVVAGAFGAHGLKSLVAPAQLEWWHTGCQYLMYHSLAGLVALACCSAVPRAVLAVRLFSLGNLFFAGSLALMTLTDMRWLGAVTPIGGVLYLAGWSVLIIGFIKAANKASN